MVSIALVIIKNFKGHAENFFYVYVSFNSICLFVLFVSYASVFMKMCCGAHPQHHGAASRERKLTVTLFLVNFNFVDVAAIRYKYFSSLFYCNF